MTNIRNKTISGFFWTFLQKIGSQGISFVIMIFLARLLVPEDFGLIAMLSVFLQISQNVVTGGFNQALIQKLDVDEVDYSSVFYINVIVSGLIYILLFITAPLVAEFYNQPLLTSLLRVLSLTFVINAFSLVQETKIVNDLDFKKLTIIQIPSTLLGGLVALLMAYYDFGVWSIVGLQISTRLTYAIQLWYYAKWKPLFIFEFQRVKTLFNFGGRMLFSTILTSVYSNIIVIIIGKFYPASQVGLYYNAKTMALTPSTTIKSIADSVTFPTFSKLQNENEKLKVAYKKVMQVLMFWMLPVFTFSAIMAEPLFRLVLGEKWVPAVPYFRWLCIIAVLSPLVNYNLNILKIKGEAKLFLKLQIYRRILTILGLIIILFFSFGVAGLLFIESLSYLVSFICFSHISGKFIGYKMKEQILDKIPMLMILLVTGFILYLLTTYIKAENDLLNILLSFFVGFGFYLGMSRLFKFQEFTDSYNILKGFGGKIELKVK